MLGASLVDLAITEASTVALRNTERISGIVCRRRAARLGGVVLDERGCDDSLYQ